jgi:hypothetical protein
MGTISAEIDEGIQGPDEREDDVQSSFYEPLRDVDGIRLLHLYSGSGEEEIVCTITHAMFSERPQYEALSYMWGSEHVVRTIAINGFYFQVRENLWSALQHLRPTSETRVLWIDALCTSSVFVRIQEFPIHTPQLKPTWLVPSVR